MLHHGEVLRQVGKVKKAGVVRIGANWRESRLDPQDKAMLEFAEYLTFEQIRKGLMSADDFKGTRAETEVARIARPLG